MSDTVTAPVGVIGHYNLLEQLEPSGPGDLFRARDTRLGRTVTIRLLPSDFALDGQTRATVLKQIETVRSVSHPNVTTVFDAGEQDGRVFVVFEHLRGQSLRAEMAGRPMNVRRAVELATQIADAVAEAHASGFVHGGLSPDTIIITAKGHAKIPAFELAAHAGFHHTGDGTRLRDYDSPEEAQGHAPDDRSDVHSVGAVLYEMVTTRRPSHKGAAAPSATNPHVPPELDGVVLRAVAPNPDLRYQSAVTLAGELRKIAAELDLHPTESDEESVEQSGGLARILIVTVVILLVIGALAWWFGVRPH
jgi:serine/threonine-protein kinase